MGRDPGLELLLRHVRRVEAGAGRLGRRADEGGIPLEPVPRPGHDPEEGQGVPGPRFSAGRGRGQAPPQVRVRRGDLPEEDVAHGPGGLDQLLQDRRVALVEQGPVVVDRGPGKAPQPVGDVGREGHGRVGPGERSDTHGGQGCDHLRESSTESRHICCCDGDLRDHHRARSGALAAWYDRNRERSEEFFDSIAPEAYETRPIPLRHPFCFYEGHLPAFSAITLLQRGFGDPPIDAELETLFQRGIDPEDESGVTEKARTWPSRIEIRSYAASADRAIREAISTRDVEDPSSPVLRGGLGPAHDPRARADAPGDAALHPAPAAVRPEDPAGGPAPAGRSAASRRGRDPSASPPAARRSERSPDAPFAWDNELPRHSVDVDAFSIDVYSVTNRDYLEFVEAGGYENESLWDAEGWAARRPDGERYPLFWERQRGVWLWRGMWDLIPLPMAWPVYVTHAEASAYARWKGTARGSRPRPSSTGPRSALPTARERAHPWGDAPADCDARQLRLRRRTIPSRSAPSRSDAARGASRTSSATGGSGPRRRSHRFEGFEPMASYPQYSADFFDGKHWVMKGASPATAKELVRASFRNWFRGTYPYMYAKFRTARSA